MGTQKQAEAPILIGDSPAIGEVNRLIETAAESDITVLLTGESGTGKTLAARRIHQLSARRAGPFVQTNCASLPETLLESELFGHERGAFTGAERQHSGRFEQADGGTLLLDEVGELSPRAQAKLLNVIEERALQRVGGEGLIHTDVRLVVATNADLRQRVEASEFRRDLFFRLGELAIRLPPLREHPQDIPALVQHFIGEINAELGKNVERVSDATMGQLLRYRWPGNVRELQNVIKSGLATAEHEAVWLEDLPLSVEIHTRDGEQAAGDLCTLEEIERRHVARVLAAVDWKKVDAARTLGISRATLDRKIAKHGLEKPE
ncbi:MAG: sigma-54 dependent transcriptional regulator [Planctomycetota bacterium]